MDNNINAEPQQFFSETRAMSLMLAILISGSVLFNSLRDKKRRRPMIETVLMSLFASLILISATFIAYRNIVSVDSWSSVAALVTAEHIKRIAVASLLTFMFVVLLFSLMVVAGKLLTLLLVILPMSMTVYLWIAAPETFSIEVAVTVLVICTIVFGVFHSFFAKILERLIDSSRLMLSYIHVIFPVAAVSAAMYAAYFYALFSFYAVTPGPVWYFFPMIALLLWILTTLTYFNKVFVSAVARRYSQDRPDVVVESLRVAFQAVGRLCVYAAAPTVLSILLLILNRAIGFLSQKGDGLFGGVLNLCIVLPLRFLRILTAFLTFWIEGAIEEKIACIGVFGSDSEQKKQFKAVGWRKLTILSAILSYVKYIQAALIVAFNCFLLVINSAAILGDGAVSGLVGVVATGGKGFFERLLLHEPLTVVLIVFSTACLYFILSSLVSAVMAMYICESSWWQKANKKEMDDFYYRGVVEEPDD